MSKPTNTETEGVVITKGGFKVYLPIVLLTTLISLAASTGVGLYNSGKADALAEERWKRLETNLDTKANLYEFNYAVRQINELSIGVKGLTDSKNDQTVQLATINTQLAGIRESLLRLEKKP